MSARKLIHFPNAKNQQPQVISPQEIAQTFTRRLCCPVCGIAEFKTTIQLAYNPLSGPKELIPLNPGHYCANCDTPLSAAVVAASGGDWKEHLKELKRALHEEILEKQTTEPANTTPQAEIPQPDLEAGEAVRSETQGDPRG